MEESYFCFVVLFLPFQVIKSSLNMLCYFISFQPFTFRAKSIGRQQGPYNKFNMASKLKKNKTKKNIVKSLCKFLFKADVGGEVTIKKSMSWICLTSHYSFRELNWCAAAWKEATQKK